MSLAISAADGEESGVMRRARSSGSRAAVNWLSRRYRTAIVRGERKSLAIVIDGGVNFAFGHQKLCRSVMRGRNFLYRSCAAGPGARFQLRDVAEIDGIIMNGEESNIAIAAHGIDLRSGNGRRGRSARGGVSEIVAIDALDDRFGNGHLSGGSFVTHAVAVFGDVTRHDPAAIFEHNGVGNRGRGGGCE